MPSPVIIKLPGVATATGLVTIPIVPYSAPPRDDVLIADFDPRYNVTMNSGSPTRIDSWQSIYGSTSNLLISPSTTSRKPVLTANAQNSRPGITFAAAFENLGMDAIAGISAAQARTIFCVAKASDPGSSQGAYGLVMCKTHQNYENYLTVWNGGLVKSHFGNDTFTVGTGTAQISGFTAWGNYKRFACTVIPGTAADASDSGALNLYVDGVAGTAATRSGKQTFGSLSIGGVTQDVSSGYTLNGVILRVLVFGAALSPSDVALVDAFLKSEYAL